MQLTFNPFKDVERLLSRKQKARLGSVKLPHADGKTGISPFSLVRALKLGSEGRAVQAKIKPFYIETSLGYWVPDALANDLSRVLEDASRSKREAWTSRRDIILSTALQKVRARYVEYVEAIRDVLTDNEIYPEKLLPKGEDPFEAERFDRFFRSICRRLKNDAIFMRLIDPFHRAGVPEIWDDRAARVEFEESFFTYLEFATSLPRCPRVPRTLLNQLPKHPTAAPDIKSALRKRLKRGWDADIWV